MTLFIENIKKNMKIPLFLEENVIKSQKSDMLKIILIEEGSAIIYINSKPYVFNAPALFCLNEKEDFLIQKGVDIKLKLIYFNPSIVNSYLDINNIYSEPEDISPTGKLDNFYFIPFINRNSSFMGHIDIGPVTATRLSNIFELLKYQIKNYEDNFWPCRNRSFLIEILFMIQFVFSKIDSVNLELPEVSENISEIILYLHLNYNKKIAVDDLIKHFHTNKNTLNKRFKKETGLSAFEYLIKLRIKIACRLLKDTTLPISEITERVGFSDISYWGRTFKRFTGLTPTNFRKGQLNDI